MPEITAIEPQAKRKDRVSIFLDGTFFCGVSREVAIGLKLKPGQQVDQQGLELLVKREEEWRIREKCLRLLERRMHSRYELTIKLKQRGIDTDTAQPVLDRLAQAGLLDDRAFAETYVRDRMVSKPMGAQRLRAELRKRGVERGIIDEVVKSEDADDETEACLAVAKKKARAYTAIDPGTAQRRLASFLVRRGYAFTLAKRVAKEIFPCTGDED